MSITSIVVAGGVVVTPSNGPGYAAFTGLISGLLAYAGLAARGPAGQRAQQAKKVLRVLDHRHLPARRGGDAAATAAAIIGDHPPIPGELGPGRAPSERRPADAVHAADRCALALLVIEQHRPVDRDLSHCGPAFREQYAAVGLTSRR